MKSLCLHLYLQLTFSVAGTVKIENHLADKRFNQSAAAEWQSGRVPHLERPLSTAQIKVNQNCLPQ